MRQNQFSRKYRTSKARNKNIDAEGFRVCGIYFVLREKLVCALIAPRCIWQINCFGWKTILSMELHAFGIYLERFTITQYITQTLYVQFWKRPPKIFFTSETYPIKINESFFFFFILQTKDSSSIKFSQRNRALLFDASQRESLTTFARNISSSPHSFARRWILWVIGADFSLTKVRSRLFYNFLIFRN